MKDGNSNVRVCVNISVSDEVFFVWFDKKEWEVSIICVVNDSGIDNIASSLIVSQKK